MEKSFSWKVNGPQRRILWELLGISAAGSFEDLSPERYIESED